MNLSQGKRILVFGTLLILGIFFLSLAVVRAKTFLAPLVTAVILALLVLPLARKMEKGPFSRGWSSFLNMFMLLIASLVLMFVFSLQVRSFIKEWPQIKKTMQPKIEQVKTYLLEHTPLTEQDLERYRQSGQAKGSSGSSSAEGSRAGAGEGRSSRNQKNNGGQSGSGESYQNESKGQSRPEGNSQSGLDILLGETSQSDSGSSSSSQNRPGQNQSSGNTQSSGDRTQNQSGGDNANSKGQAGESDKSSTGIPSFMVPSNPGQMALGFFSTLINSAGTYLLCFIYIFFLLNYRGRFKQFLIRLFPEEEQENVKNVTEKSAKVAERYLVGKLVLMAILFVLYSIGLGISGVSNFILVSALAAVFTLIPYIGNIVGFAMAMVFGYLTSGDIMVLVGILATFTLAQFFENYVLQPYVIGDKVDLHPFFVILVVIAGNMVWGVIGMILAIPILGIINVVFRHIPVLHPLGFLLSKKDPYNSEGEEQSD